MIKLNKIKTTDYIPVIGREVATCVSVSVRDPVYFSIKWVIENWVDDLLSCLYLSWIKL